MCREGERGRESVVMSRRMSRHIIDDAQRRVYTLHCAHRQISCIYIKHTMYILHTYTTPYTPLDYYYAPFLILNP